MRGKEGEGGGKGGEEKCDRRMSVGTYLQRNTEDNLRQVSGKSYQEEKCRAKKSDLATFLAALSSTAGTSGR